MVAPEGAGPVRRRRRRNPSAATWSILLFPVPALALFTIFFAIPTVQAFQYAVTDWDGYSADFTQVGVANFLKVATDDNLFANALLNNAKFLLLVLVVQTAVSLLLAILLVRNSRGSTVLRALFFFPTILSSVSVAFIWKFVYDPNFGLVNSALAGLWDVLGLDSPPQGAFLGAPGQAIWWVALAQCWAHIGQMMVVYVAGLQGVPAEYYEAARVDGASRWRQFVHITWPQIAPATGIVVAYTTIQSFKAFDLILGMSGIPPKGSLDILSTRIYSTFANSEYGYAAAESVLFMALIAVVTALQRRTLSATQRREA